MLVLLVLVLLVLALVVVVAASATQRCRPSGTLARSFSAAAIAALPLGSSSAYLPRTRASSRRGGCF